jgi:predicted transcriptional regulator
MAKLPRPTDGELAILRVLWEGGPATVREVHERLGRDTAYTTVLKLLQIMTTKGLVTRDERRRTHVYAAAAPASQTQRQIVKDLVERVFGGSAGRLVLQALSAKRASAEEMAEIRRLLDEHEKSGGGA